MKGSGRIIKNMVKEYMSGQMADVMKEIIAAIKNMDKGLILGLMGGNISDNGRMIKGTEGELMLSIVNYRKKVFGRRIKE